MKKARGFLGIVFSVLFAAFLLLVSPRAAAAPLRDVPVNLEQPDGNKVSFFASGDEYFHYYHDASGFLITQDEEGWYVYAKAEGGRPVPTSYIVGRAGARARAMPTAMTYEDIDFEKNPDLRHDELEMEREPFLQGGGASTYSFAEDQGPTDQHMANLVVFIRFPGEEEFVQTRNGHPVITFSDGKEVDLRERYDQVSEYMQKVSHGKFNVETTFLTADPGSGNITSAVAPRSRSAYEGNLTDRARRDLEMEMLDYALDQTKDSAPDGFQLDYNKDHYIDNVTFIVSGEVGGWNSLLWPHSWVFQNYSCGIDTGDGSKWVYQFNFNFGHPRYAGLGVLSHELLHAVGYPDLYRYSYNGYPVGKWDAMATTDYSDPQFLGGYLKARYAGWGNVEELTESGTYTLKPIGTDDDSVETYLIPTEETYEYIAIECRKPDKSGVPNPSTDNVPTEGLVVYRVNQLAVHGNRNGDPGQNDDEVYVFREGDLSVNAGTTGLNDAYLDAAALQAGESFGTPDLDVRPNGEVNPIYLGNGKNTGIVIDNVVIDEETGEATFRVSLPAGDPEITPDGTTTYNVDARDYLIKQSGDYHFAGSTQDHHIIVASGDEVNIYLNNVTMNLSAVNKVAPILVRSGAKVNLYLSGESHLNGGEFAAAVAVSPNAELHIYSQNPQARGKLIAVGGNGCAGVGSNAVSPHGKITAEGVEITARGGNGYIITSGNEIVFSTYGAAGIGGREDEAGDEIALKDCVLNLTGGVPEDIGGTIQYAISNGWMSDNREVFGRSDISIINCQVTTTGGIMAGQDVLIQNSALTCEGGFVSARRHVTLDQGSASISGDDWGILVGSEEGKATIKGGAQLKITNVGYAVRGKAPGFFQAEAGTHVTMLSTGKYPVSYDGLSGAELAKLAFQEPFGIRAISCWLDEALKGETVFRLQRNGVVRDSIYIPAESRSFFITVPEDGTYSFRDNNEACTQELTVLGEGVHGWEQLTFRASDEKAKKWDIAAGSLHIAESGTAYTVYGSSSTNTVTVDPDLQNVHIYLQGVTYRGVSPFLTLGENARVDATVVANTENILESSGGAAISGETGSAISFNGTGKLSAAGKGAPAIQSSEVRIDHFLQLAAYSDTADAVVQSGSVWTPDMGMEPILAFLEFNKPLSPGLSFHIQSESTSTPYEAPQSFGAFHGVFTLAAQGDYTMRTEENEYASMPCPNMVNRLKVSLHGEQGVEESIDISTPTKQYSLRENGTYTVTGECTSGEARCITAESGVTATVILDGVKYTRDELKTQLPFLSLQGSASVTLVLRNTSEIFYDANSSPLPAISVPGGAVLTIQEDEEHPGVLNMTGPIAAPDKPSFRKSCGTLVLRGGTLNLAQHFGYVFGGTNAKIRILGGRIRTDAVEGDSIGCGVGGVNSDIQISGGELELNRGYEKNGILGGENSRVTITGGSVTIHLPDDLSTCVGGDYSVVMMDGGSLNIVDPFRSYVAINLPLAVGGDGSSTNLNSGHVYIQLLRGGSSKGMMGGRSAEMAFGKSLDLTIVNYQNELYDWELFNKYCEFTSECGTFLGELDVNAKEEMTVCVSQNGAPLREKLILPLHTGSFLFTAPMGEDEFLPFDLTLDTPAGDYGGGWSLSRNTVKTAKEIVFGRPRIRLDDASFPYDGQPHSLAVAGETGGVSISYSGNGQTEPGSYKVTATITPAGKTAYTLTATMTILKTPLPILSVTARDKEYDGTDNAELTVTTDGASLPDNAFSYVARFDSAAVGSSKPVSIAGLKLSGEWVQRYELTGEVPKTSTASIQKKTLDITFEEDAGLLQSTGQTVRPVKPTFRGIVEGESLSEDDYTVTYQPSAGGTASTDVPTVLGSYHVLVTVNTEHYQGSGSATLEIVEGHDIGASSLTITTPGVYLVYGSTDANHIEVRCDGVTLLLCGVQISPASGPAVKVSAADLTLLAENDTENLLSASSGAAVECTAAAALTLEGEGYCSVVGRGTAPALSGPFGSTCGLGDGDVSPFVFSAEGNTVVQDFRGISQGENMTSMVSIGFAAVPGSDMEYIAESFGGETRAVLPVGCRTLALCLPSPTFQLSGNPKYFNATAFLTLRESADGRVLRVSRYSGPTVSLTGLPLAASEKTGSFDLKQGPVSITESGRYTITGDPGAELSNKITVDGGLAVELVLQDVRVKGAVSDTVSGLIQCGEDTALKVEFQGNCQLTSTGGGLCLYAGEGSLVELDGSGTLEASSAGTAVESRGRLIVYDGTYDITAQNSSGNAHGLRAAELVIKDGKFDISCSTASTDRTDFSAAICALGRQFDEDGFHNSYYLPSLTIQGGRYNLSLSHGASETARDYNGVIYAFDIGINRGTVAIEGGSFHAHSRAAGTPFIRCRDAVISGGEFQLEMAGQPSFGIWSNTLQMGKDVSLQAWFGVESIVREGKKIESASLKVEKLLPLDGYTPCVLEFYMKGRFFDYPGKVSIVSVDDYPDQPILAEVPKTEKGQYCGFASIIPGTGSYLGGVTPQNDGNSTSPVYFASFEKEVVASGVTRLEVPYVESGSIKRMDVSLRDESFQYDGTVKSLRLRGNIPQNAVVTYGGNSAVDPGEYEVSVSVRALGYADVTASATMTIEPALLSVLPQAEDKEVYDGTSETTGTFSLDGVVLGDQVEIASGAKFTFADPNVGENKEVSVTNVSLTGKDAEKYTLGDETEFHTTASILNPAPVTIDVMQSSLIQWYDGNAKQVQASAMATTLKDPSDPAKFLELPCQVLYNGRPYDEAGAYPSEAGAYTVQIAVNEPNFQEVSRTETMHIVLPVITGVSLEDSTVVYTGRGQGAAVTGALPTDQVVYTYGPVSAKPSEFTSALPVNAGVYQVNATVTRDSFQPLELAARLVIQPKEAVLQGIQVPAVKATDPLTFSVQDSRDFDKTASGILAEDEVTVSYTAAYRDSVPGENKPVDLTNVTLGGPGAGNYILASTRAQGMGSVLEASQPGPGSSGGDVPAVPDRPDGPPVWENPFTDVESGAWYEDAVQFVVESGLFYGTSDTTFSPHDNMTRGMLATVLYRLAKEPNAAVSDLFSDVETGRYYTEAIAWAAEAGIVSGYDGSHFGPDDPVTREQLAAILWRYAGEPEATESLDGFTDSGKAGKWAVTALQWAVEQKIISGRGSGILDPKGKADRAEVAAMLMRYCKGAE